MAPTTRRGSCPPPAPSGKSETRSVTWSTSPRDTSSGLRWLPRSGPFPPMIFPAFQWIDYSVHSWDIRAGLGEMQPLSDDAANTLMPYMFIVLQSTVDAEAAKGFEAT